MGRPRIGKRAMSAAERQRRHRAKCYSKPVTKLARKRVAALRRLPPGKRRALIDHVCRAAKVPAPKSDAPP